MGTLGYRKQACKRGHQTPPRTKSGGCLLCVKDYRAENYQRDRERRIAYAVRRSASNPEVRRDEQRAVRLGVCVAEVRAAIAKCSGKCEACSVALTHAQMCIDHCHATGRVRGVLCRFCNALEGMLNKKAGRVEMVQAYVQREIEKRSKATT